MRTASARLTKDGLSEDQLLHFSEHGWLVLEGVLNAGQCRAYTEHIDRCLDVLSPSDTTVFYSGRDFMAPYAPGADELPAQQYAAPGPTTARSCPIARATRF